MDQYERANYLNLAIGIVGLVVSVYIYFIIIPTTTVIPPGVKAPQYISIDFMPKLWTLICILSSIGLIIQSMVALRKIKLRDVIQSIVRKGAKLRSFTFSFVGFIVVMIIYILTLPYVGFLVNSALFLFISMYWFGYRGFVKISLLSILISLACYALFVYVLNASLSF